MAITCLHTNCCVAASSIQDSYRKNSTHLSQRTLSLILCHACLKFLDGGNFGLLSFGHLNEHHR
jgi:hypothetical protein